MKLAVLFSGGKDSAYALFKAMKEHEVCCLITLKSRNKESYMFHTPNIDITSLQAESIGLPLLSADTQGEKEKEVEDLKNAIIHAEKLFKIEGVVTGAIESVYQAKRIQDVCSELGLWCFNPLWQIDQIRLLEELIENRFEIIISGVFAYPFDKSWLGKKINTKTIDELKALKDRYKINPAGEGGEYESLVLDAPVFSKKITVIKKEIRYSNYAGVFEIKEAKLE